MQNRNLPLFILLLSSVFLSSCTIPFSLQDSYKFKKSNIKLKVDGESLGIDYHDGPRCGSSDRDSGKQKGKKGCIKANRGTIALIDFHLVASKDWYFTEMKICSGGNKPSESNPCSMTECQRSEFSVGASGQSTRYQPDSKGRIDLKKFSNELTKFNLQNGNRFPIDPDSDPQLYYYTITACNGSNCITLDPPIENQGGGGIGRN